MYVVIRQLLLLRDEFRIPKLTFHSDLLHSTLEKNPIFYAKTLRSSHRARPTNSKKCAERQWAPPPVFMTLILSRVLTRLLCRLATNAPRRRPITARCTTVGLLPLLREEFRLLKLILHSELRRRAALRRALPCPSSFTIKCPCSLRTTCYVEVDSFIIIFVLRINVSSTVAYVSIRVCCAVI